jgi:hypothetical protein
LKSHGETVSKRATQQRFNLKDLGEVEVREQYQVKGSKRFAALENLDDGGDINRVCENIRRKTKISVS